jgi:NTP pyrophosphatase (non-canonical NTP hydrolase)
MTLDTGVVKAWENPGVADTINLLAFDIAHWAERKGFWKELEHLLAQDDSPVTRLKKCEKIVLVITELAELVEGLRGKAESSIEGFTNEEEETADAIIRLLDYAGHYNLRIGEAIAAKMAKNEGRPYMHGKKF